jgi:hypothetical protein
MDKGNRELPAEIAETPVLIPETALPAPRWRSLSALIAVIMILLVILGVMIYSHLKYARLESELNRYESLWNEQEIPNYNYTITQYSETVIQVRVDNGIITSKSISEDGDINSVIISEENIGLKQSSYDYNTVEKLFTTIRGAIEEREEVIKVTYNQSLGYPTQLFVSDRLYMSRYGFNVSDFYIPDSNYLQRESELNSLESVFTRYESLWNEQAISNYSFVISKSTSSDDWKASIRVRDGIPTSTSLTEHDGGLNLDMYYYNTLQKLFQYIHDAIKDWADVIEVTYNPNLGYPMDVYINPSLTAPDDEYSFSISDFYIPENGE